MGIYNDFNKEACLQSFEMDKCIFDYLENHGILNYYSLDNERDLRALCLDFNDYSGSKCSIEKFLQAAKFYQKIAIRPTFSFFRKPIFNIFPYKTISITQLYEIIVNPKCFQTTTETYRKLMREGNANDYKSKNFDYVIFSGCFSKRNSNALLRHSGLMVIDIDKVTDTLSLKNTLLNDVNIPTEMLFVSPGGEGIKWIIKSYPEEHKHEMFFSGVSAYLKKQYGIEADQSGKDVSRACFICYDPDAYINPQYL